MNEKSITSALRRPSMTTQRLSTRTAGLVVLGSFAIALIAVGCNLFPIPGPAGEQGSAGEDGEDGLGVEITNFHGTARMLSTGNFADAGKFFATATVTSATADVGGTVTVDFTVADGDGDPVVGVTGVDFTIVALAPASSGESFNKWVPYIYRTQTVENSADGDWPNPDGTTAYQGYRESEGTFTDNGDGSYTYVFETDISSVTVDGTAITYDRSLTHRVSIMMGGSSGPTADANFDFVPNGSAVTETRNIVETATCKKCHGVEFDGHGGDRLSVENCVTCHTVGNWDPHGGETIDAKVMIHKIHAGGEVASIPGADGAVWDDPATGADESADNGEYAIWGYRDTKHEWWKVGFPAIIRNCTKCHQGSGEDVDNWKNKPSREACGSCHDDINWATGTNHGGGAQATDDGCTFCHPATGTGGFAPSVTEAHDWTTKDIRNTPEFTVDLSVSTPGNGMYFQAGESPVVTVVINDGGTPIDHTTVVEDDDGAEGCPEGGPLPAADGKFYRAYLFVHGPRAKRNPVLTTTARVEILSDGTGPWDISAADASLDLKVDAGRDLLERNTAGRSAETTSGTISVDVADGTFASTAAATEVEIVIWLNADEAFAARCFAYIDEATGFAAIRSRNLGDFFAIQLQTSAVATAVFAGDTAVKLIGGYYPGNAMYQHTVPAEDDPKVAWTTGAITYTLDPVNDLEPGTYVASVEIGDRGRISGTDYKTPSVAKTTFQVGTATEEVGPANNCESCHWGPEDTGFVLDFARHNKLFNSSAVDQCGACHDYQSGHADGDWYGANPISRRVHAVHYGSSLNFPNTTVNYNADPVTGRSWDITFPQDVRFCEACHPSDTSSGSWATKPARLPCSGCHDSEAATAHMTLMTWDPTPADPFSGDEEESCQVCHAAHHDD
jgi:OmcA/MtrC family decaheme c-type cytochrome